MKFKITLLFLLITNLLSNTDYIEIYRKDGIKAIEKLLQEEMKKNEYWKNHIENKNVENGFYENPKYILIANKKNHKIDVFDNSKMENSHLFTANVLLGEKAGQKQMEGDLKTPIGAYKLTKKLTQLDPFYGSMALVTNYPNTFDKVKKRTGSGIWIHGVPKEDVRDPYTKGCIALENKEIEDLDQKINLKESILLISDKDRVPTSKEDVSLLMSSLFQWKDSWKRSNIEEYLSFYSNDFEKLNGMKINRFKKYKTRIFNKKEKKIIRFKDISIIPYPNDLNKKMFKIEFYQNYRTNVYRFKGNKELFVEIIDNKMKILSEN